MDHPTPILLGYWNVRGLAEPIRTLLSYLEIEFMEKMYEIGDAPEYDKQAWLDDKFSLDLNFPNLPYLIDGKFRMTESFAIMKYICRKYNPHLLGSTIQEQATLSMVQSVVYDLRLTISHMCCLPIQETNNFNEVVEEKMEYLCKYFEKRQGPFLIGKQVSYVDFYLIELIEAYNDLLEPILDKFHILRLYFESFVTLPKIIMYRKTRIPLPYNNKVALLGGAIVQSKIPQNIKQAVNMASSSFKELGVGNWLLNNLKKLSIESPTQIQSLAIPHIFSKKNVIASAQTGSGKTLSFALPILHFLAKDPFGIFAVIITPTRELALQISQQFTALSENFNLRQLLAIGGMSIQDQETKIGEIPHIIIGCPGRLRGLLEKNEELRKYMGNLEILVIDEADRVLETNCYLDVKKIVEFLPATRQTLMFSATMNRKLTSKHAFHYIGTTSELPIYVDTNTEQLRTVQELTQKYLFIPINVRECYFVYLIQNFLKEGSCIVFTSTCKKCHFLSLLLERLEISSVTLHSYLPQKVRFQNLEKFKSNYARILIATDVASRGLDIPQVELVVNYDIPRSSVDYVHRVGRTARAGKEGMSVSLVTQYDVALVLSIENYINKKLVELKLEQEKVLEEISRIAKIMQIVKIEMSENGLEKAFEQGHNNNNKKRVHKKSISSSGSSITIDKSLSSKRIRKISKGKRRKKNKPKIEE